MMKEIGVKFLVFVFCVSPTFLYTNAMETESETIEMKIQEDWKDVTGFVFKSYNNSMTFIKEEIEHFGMSPHQKVGVLLIFLVSALLLTSSIIFLCCGSCWRNKDEEKYIVYRRMVEIDHIIALEPPKSEYGKFPI